MLNLEKAKVMSLNSKSDQELEKQLREIFVGTNLESLDANFHSQKLGEAKILCEELLERNPNSPIALEKLG